MAWWLRWQYDEGQGCGGGRRSKREGERAMKDMIGREKDRCKSACGEGELLTLKKKQFFFLGNWLSRGREKF